MKINKTQTKKLDIDSLTVKELKEYAQKLLVKLNKKYHKFNLKSHSFITEIKFVNSISDELPNGMTIDIANVRPQLKDKDSSASPESRIVGVNLKLV